MLLSCQRQGSLHTASYLLVQKTMNQFWQLPVEIIVIKKAGDDRCVKQEASANKVRRNCLL